MSLSISDEGLVELQRDARLGRELTSILSHYCGEHGANEGAVETLNRIILERDNGILLRKEIYNNFMKGLCLKSTAILTLKKPGSLTSLERKDIVVWLRHQANNLLKHGKDYNDTGNFTARYGSVRKS